MDTMSTLFNSSPPSGPSGPRRDASRPYRSHRFPACDFCRKRKSRCVRSLDNQKCVLCQMHGAECTQDGIANGPRRVRPYRMAHSIRSSAERQPLSHTLSLAKSTLETDDELHTANVNPGSSMDVLQDIAHGPDSNLTMRSVDAQSSHIVGPVVAHDVQVLDQYMSPQTPSPKSMRKSQPYSVYSDDPKNPILYLRVPRRRERLATGNGNAGFAQCEAISKVLEPHCNDVFDL